MKIIILLFSFYMLALPVIAQRVDACAETEVCIEEEGTCLPDGCSDEENDDCGSFCACSCCVHNVSVNFYSPRLMIQTNLVKNVSQSFYDNISLPSNYFGNIWQPPRIA